MRKFLSFMFEFVDDTIQSISSACIFLLAAIGILYLGKWFTVVFFIFVGIHFVLSKFKKPRRFYIVAEGRDSMSSLVVEMEQFDVAYAREQIKKEYGIDECVIIFYKEIE